MQQGDLFGKQKPKPVGNFPGTYLFFDTETTGLPKNWNAPVTDLQNWPRLVQLAFVCYKDGFEVESKDYIIKPEGFVIPDDTAKVHGINTQMANEKGIALQIVLNEFASLLERADFVVAHNMSFDEKIMGAEFLRKNMIISRQFAQKKFLLIFALFLAVVDLKNLNGQNFQNCMQNYLVLILQILIMHLGM